MSISVIDDWNEFQAIRSIWNRVLGESGSFAIQLTHEWLSSYWKHLAGDANVEILVHENKNGRVLGFTPLMTRRQPRLAGLMGYSELTFLADDFTDYSDFILAARRGAILDDVVIPYISRKKESVDRIVLRRIRSTSPNWSVLKRAWGHEFQPTTENLFCNLGDRYEDYIIGRGRNIRREVKKRHNRLLEDGLTVQLDYFDDLTPSLLSEMVECSRRRASGSRHTGVLACPKSLKHIHEFSRNSLSRGKLAGWTLRCNGSLIGYRLGFLVGDVFFDWQTDYDMQFSEYSVGKLLLAGAIEDCFRRNIRVFDFMVGAEPYKLSWANDMTLLYSFQWQSSSFSNRVYRAAKSLRELLVRSSA